MFASVVPSSLTLSMPGRLYAIATTPMIVGSCTSVASPPAAAISVAVMGTSEAPKSTVFFVNAWMPPPDPIAW